LTDTTWMTDQDKEQDAKVCTFIQALRDNRYDENGEVYIPTDYSWAHWKQGTEYVKLARQANMGQLLALLVSMGLAASLAGYAIYLQKKLWFRKAWVPPRDFIDYTLYGNGRGDNDDDDRSNDRHSRTAGRLSRMHSGIVALRSRSSSDSVSPPKHPPARRQRPYQPYGAPIPQRQAPPLAVERPSSHHSSMDDEDDRRIV
jgi:hypothetical protein